MSMRDETKSQVMGKHMQGASDSMQGVAQQLSCALVFEMAIFMFYVSVSRLEEVADVELDHHDHGVQAQHVALLARADAVLPQHVLHAVATRSSIRCPTSCKQMTYESKYAPNLVRTEGRQGWGHPSTRLKHAGTLLLHESVSSGWRAHRIQPLLLREDDRTVVPAKHTAT